MGPLFPFDTILDEVARRAIRRAMRSPDQEKSPRNVIVNGDAINSSFGRGASATSRDINVSRGLDPKLPQGREAGSAKEDNGCDL